MLQFNLLSVGHVHVRVDMVESHENWHIQILQEKCIKMSTNLELEQWILNQSSVYLFKFLRPVL